MTIEQKLTLEAANAARAAPESWGRFLAAFKAYADELRDNVVQSPLDTLQVNQGRAQTTARIQKILESCVQTADKLKSVK